MYKSYNKTFKTIVVFFLISVLLSLSASAVSISGTKFKGIEFSNIAISVQDSSGNMVEIPNITLDESVYSDAILIRCDFTGPFVVDELYLLSCNLKASFPLDSADYFVVGGYDIEIDGSEFDFYAYGQLSSRTGKNSSLDIDNQYANMSRSPGYVKGYEGVRYSYDAGILGIKYDLYTSQFYFKPVKENVTRFYIVLCNVNFRNMTPEEYALQSSQETEKGEAQSSGNSAADDVTAAVPNKSEGFVTALRSFVQVMSTSDTECILEMPAIVIPKLEGLFPETSLISKQSLNFSQVISLIPGGIMAVIRAVTDIGLIVYCFKELYSTIEYVLTLRKGGSSE